METDSRITAVELQCFQASLARVTGQARFFEQFYARLFRESDEIKDIFRGRDLTSIIAKLRMTLSMVAQAAEGRPGLEMYLEMLGNIHRRVQVEARFFRHWRTALLDTVARYDAQYDPRVEAVWRRVIDRVIACMQQGEQENPAP